MSPRGARSGMYPPSLWPGLGFQGATIGALDTYAGKPRAITLGEFGWVVAKFAPIVFRHRQP
jgi:hypothetical protein